MRAREFIKLLLVEYKQDLSMRQFGPAILKQLKNPTHPDYRQIISQHRVGMSNFYDPQTQQWDDERLLKAAFRYFEDADPTYNTVNASGGIYVPWIAREFSKGNIRRLEDLDSRVRPLLVDYHKFKNRRDFWEPMPEIKDIMRTNFDHLEEYVGRYEPQIEQKDRGTAVVLYDDKDVRIIQPQDQTAACYYGQGTRWCTASTKGTNYFDHYNRDGPLYILLPKNPQHSGEKYQLHFPSSSYMDENDDPVNLIDILKKRFPGALEFFKKSIPTLEEMVMFAPDSTLEEVFHTVANYALDIAYEMVNEWEMDDEYYHEWQLWEAKRKGYFTPESDYLKRAEEAEENGDSTPTPRHDDIDWDRVHEDDELNDYADFNSTVGELISLVQSFTEIPANDIRHYAEKIESPRDGWLITSLEYLVGKCIFEDAERDLRYSAEKIKQRVGTRVVIRNRFVPGSNEPRTDKPNSNLSWTVLATTEKYEIGIMGQLTGNSR